MKNLSILIFALFILSCKKESVEKETNLKEITVHILLGYNASYVYDYCDSSYVELYKDNALVFSGYTDSEGKIIFKNIVKGGDYYFKFTSKTYTDGFKIYTYKGNITLNTVSQGDRNNKEPNSNNVYICVGGGIGRYSENGTTAIPTKDLFAIVEPFNPF